MRVGGGTLRDLSERREQTEDCKVLGFRGERKGLSMKNRYKQLIINCKRHSTLTSIRLWKHRILSLKF